MSNIAIISPAPIKGSGGVARIYGLCQTLINDGHNCHIYVFDAPSQSNEDLIKNSISYFSVISLPIFNGLSLQDDYDLIIATRWDTAKIVRDMPSRHKAYLIQDFEACFNQVGDGTIFAENSYLYGLQTITYGRWLANKLHVEYGNDPYFCDFSSDLDTFYVTKQMRDRLNKPPKICFIYQHDKPRRCPTLGIEALGIVKNIHPEAEIYFVGSDQSPDIWYDYKNLGLLSTKELNDIYNQCHIGLCLSPSNPSCNPFDMMAAGLPCVELYKQNNLLDIPDGGVLLAHQTPESIAEAIIRIITSKTKLLAMSDFGVNFMRTRSASLEQLTLLEIVKKILKGDRANFRQENVLNTLYTAEAVISQGKNYSQSIKNARYNITTLQRDAQSAFYLGRF